jgi:hypothetical protein
MDHGSEGRGLRWWAGPGQDLGAAYDAVLKAPRLAAAVQALAGGMLDLAAQDSDLLAIFKDAGRYSAAMWAFYLHESGELTLARLREICAKSGLQSAGRVRALLQFLHHLGYVERRAAGGRTAAYAITDRFAVAWDRHLRTALTAAAILEPEVLEILAASEPSVVTAFGRVHAEGLLAVSTPGSAVPRIMRVFLHPYGGSQILWALLCASEGDAFPPSMAGPISAAGLAIRFQISRIQVKRVFAAAQQEDLAWVDAQGMVRFTQDAQQEVLFLYAIQLVMILGAAGRTEQVCGLPARQAVA